MDPPEAERKYREFYGVANANGIYVDPTVKEDNDETPPLPSDHIFHDLWWEHYWMVSRDQQMGNARLTREVLEAIRQFPNRGLDRADGWEQLYKHGELWCDDLTLQYQRARIDARHRQGDHSIPQYSLTPTHGGIFYRGVEIIPAYYHPSVSRQWPLPDADFEHFRQTWEAHWAQYEHDHGHDGFTAEWRQYLEETQTTSNIQDYNRLWWQRFNEGHLRYGVEVQQLYDKIIRNMLEDFPVSTAQGSSGQLQAAPRNQPTPPQPTPTPTLPDSGSRPQSAQDDDAHARLTAASRRNIQTTRPPFPRQQMFPRVIPTSAPRPLIPGLIARSVITPPGLSLAPSSQPPLHPSPVPFSSSTPRPPSLILLVDLLAARARCKYKWLKATMVAWFKPWIPLILGLVLPLPLVIILVPVLVRVITRGSNPKMLPWPFKEIPPGIRQPLIGTSPLLLWLRQVVVP